MKNVLLIATGGTIASKPTDAGMAPVLDAEELLSCVPEVAGLCRVDKVQPFNLDSTNVCAKHWLEIARIIETNYERYDGFVVTLITITAFQPIRLIRLEVSISCRILPSPSCSRAPSDPPICGIPTPAVTLPTRSPTARTIMLRACISCSTGASSWARARKRRVPEVIMPFRASTIRTSP